jgi:hypothetical protein
LDAGEDIHPSAIDSEEIPLRYRIVPMFIVAAIIFAGVQAGGQLSSASPDPVYGRSGQPSGHTISIHRIQPARPGGQAYRLVYRVDAPVAVYWRFKTDFDNDFLVDNEYIRDHRFIDKTGDTVITEDKYTYGPDVYFKWRTRMDPRRLRLDFILLNPDECGEKYHYGHIRLDADGEGTRVTQVAYFDFWGASFWAHYPWRGGMRDVLVSTARWEQTTVVRLKDRYDEDTAADK